MNGRNREITKIEPTLSLSMKKWLTSLLALVSLFVILATISVPAYNTYIEEAKRTKTSLAPQAKSTPSPMAVMNSK